MDTKEHWARVSRKRPTTYNLARKREAVRAAKNLMKSLKRAYVEEAIAECNGDYMKLWKVIKRFWPGKSKKIEISKIMDEANSANIAEMINKHFCNIGPKLAATFENNNERNTGNGINIATAVRFNCDRPQLAPQTHLAPPVLGASISSTPSKPRAATPQKTPNID